MSMKDRAGFDLFVIALNYPGNGICAYVLKPLDIKFAFITLFSISVETGQRLMNNMEPNVHIFIIAVDNYNCTSPVT